MDTASQWPPQGFHKVVEKREIRASKEASLNCPRCNSLNTKFCYYNNYSLSQPRHFCKACKRYWTQGGTLRNIPVGGASRKNKRPSSSSSSSSSSKQIIPPSNLSIHGGSVDPSQNPSLTSNPLSQGSSFLLPMISSADSTNPMNIMFSSNNLMFPLQELKQTLNYEPHHYSVTSDSGNGDQIHREEMATVNFDGLFNQTGRGQEEHHHSIGFGLNNGIFDGI